MRKIWLLAMLCTPAALMRADFTYSETTQMTGGSMAAMMRAMGPLAGRAREPQASTHIVKGNRMATISRDTATIIDLDKETITNIDHSRKQYSVTSFADMQQRIQRAQQTAKGRAKENSNGDVQTNFKVSAKATGQTKTIQGLSAKEMVVTITTEFADAQSGQSGAMQFVTDSWLAPLPGYEEVREFYKKMGAKIGAAFGSGMPQVTQMNMSQPGLTKGMEEMAKEMQKLDGIPVESVTKMGGPGSANASAAPPPDNRSGACSADSPSQQSTVSGALAGALGGFGGFGGGKRDKSQSQSDCAPSSNAGGASSYLMETTTALSGFSSGPADASKFEIPAGYKMVEAPGR